MQELSVTKMAQEMTLAGRDIPGNLDDIASAYQEFKGSGGEVKDRLVTPEEDVQRAHQADEQETDESVSSSESPEDSGENDVETIQADGKKIKIDWKNRDVIKKYLQYGVAYKTEKEAKDKALYQVKELQDKISSQSDEHKSNSDILKKIQDAKAEGIAKVAKLLYGRDLDDLLGEVEERQSWSDERKENYALKKEIAELKSLVDSVKNQTEESVTKTRQEKEEAIRTNVRTHFEASYRKHQFDGKLGDSGLEDDLDDRMWSKVKSQFDGRELSEINPADVDRAFRMERARLLKIYGGKSDKRVVADIDRKKKEALVKAQARAGRGEKKQTLKERFDELVSKGKFSTIAKDPALRGLLNK